MEMGTLNGGVEVDEVDGCDTDTGGRHMKEVDFKEKCEVCVEGS